VTGLLKSPAAAILAVLTMLGLLVSLTVVVQGITQRSALRHRAEAEQARSLWQCGSLSGAALRAECRLQLTRARPPASPAVDGRTALLANAR